MYFHLKHIKLTLLPNFTLNDSILVFVDKCKYLGTFIETGSSDADIKRQMRKFYAIANMLLRKFNNCSYDVKCMLFKTFCTNLYCCKFWYMSAATSMNRLNISYNNSLRRLLNLPKWNSASEMFVNLNILSFDEILRKTVYSFIERIKGSENKIIYQIVNSALPLCSKRCYMVLGNILYICYISDMVCTFVPIYVIYFTNLMSYAVYLKSCS